MNSGYIERIVSDLHLENTEEHSSHFDHLDWILGRIEGVPSPEKESLLVDLLTGTPIEDVKAPRPHSSL